MTFPTEVQAALDYIRLSDRFGVEDDGVDLRQVLILRDALLATEAARFRLAEALDLSRLQLEHVAHELEGLVKSSRSAASLSVARYEQARMNVASFGGMQSTAHSISR